MMACKTGAQRFCPNAGIAIGPILFIIAILAILATAIAAGSGNFTGSTTKEGDKTKSSALIQIGENLKLGMDQLTMDVGTPLSLVKYDIADTGDSLGLFSPTGGGISPPSIAISNNPLYDKWFFVVSNSTSPVTGFGSGAGEVMAVLSVSAGVCSEVNNRVMGVAGIPTGANLGDFTANALSGTWPVGGTNSWSSVSSGGTVTASAVNGPSLQQIMTGCVENSSVTPDPAGPTSKYFFYQVLAVQ